jgi:phosphoglycolate phosphatase-like HAD superfamily hydrolase
MATVIFFDINGTIVKRDSRTDIPYQNAVDAFLDVTNGMEGVDTSARSDKDVFMEVLERHGESFSEEKWKEFLEIYEQQLKKFATTDVWRENADAVPFIKKVFEKGYKLALISGELRIGARYKLEKLGVWQYFLTGGFGEDGLRRFEIAETAMKNVRNMSYASITEIFVIGDTILDIKTARHLDAKVISIATGSNSYEELKAESPDYLIRKFAELDELF